MTREIAMLRVTDKRLPPQVVQSFGVNRVNPGISELARQASLQGRVDAGYWPVVRLATREII